MSKHQKTLQIFAQIGRVFSLVIFVLSIVGAVGCLVGIVTIAAVQNIVYDGKTIAQIIEEQSKTTMASIYSSMIIGLVFCGGEIALAKMAELFFKKEIEVGHPFDKVVSKKCFELGLAIIIIGIACTIISAISVAIVAAVMQQKVGNFDIGSATNVGLGLAFMFMSLVLSTGAEREEIASKKNEEPKE